MNNYRLRFSKEGRAVWISHLDLMHTFVRAFSRAGIRLRYSEGFNPHAAVSIALPLSVGQSSVCEVLDFETADAVTRADAVAALNSALPEGIAALEITVPNKKAAAAKWLRVRCVLGFDELPDVTELRRFFDRESLVVSKKTKRGETQLDLIPAVREVRFSTDGASVTISALVSAQNPTVNPTLIADALGLTPRSCAITREAVLCEDFSEFR
ncbi:MAG: TIGR03936 family radical SAM-associated protein [Oscillospiraceae bacterium]|jgi:radical SAM-linked protein|nr:TIGR03936 family radical SAM-associated protein [Oscillospiraceae bacterium]